MELYCSAARAAIEAVLDAHGSRFSRVNLGEPGFSHGHQSRMTCFYQLDHVLTGDFQVAQRRMLHANYGAGTAWLRRTKL